MSTQEVKGNLARLLATENLTVEHKVCQTASFDTDKNVKDGTSCVKGVVTGLQALIAEQRQVSSLAAERDDQGTADLVDEYVQEQEKLVWMYNAFLG